MKVENVSSRMFFGGGVRGGVAEFYTHWNGGDPGGSLKSKPLKWRGSQNFIPTGMGDHKIYRVNFAHFLSPPVVVNGHPLIHGNSDFTALKIGTK